MRSRDSRPGPACCLLLVLGLVSAPSQAVGQSHLVAPFRLFETGPGPSSVAIADLDGDSHPDMVIANADSSTVTVLLGDGHGGFGARTDYAAGGSPFGSVYAAAVADLNADGMPDLAVANGSSYGISVLLNEGGGRFGDQRTFDSGGSSRFVAAGDVNADGRPDLLVTEEYANTVTVLLGNGDGTFGAPTPYMAGALPDAVAIGDLNGDGRPDLAVTNAADDAGTAPASVTVLLGDGAGGFALSGVRATGQRPFSVAIGDLNRDGRADLVTANIDDNTLTVLLGNGDGTFQPRRDVATGGPPASVAIADVNGDAIPDLVTANASSTVTVLPGLGDGSFGPATQFSAGGGPSCVAPGDFNADGKCDLAVADGAWGANSVAVLLGNGDGSFGVNTAFAIGGSPRSLAIGDLNGDRNADLAVANSNAQAISILPGDGHGGFKKALDAPVAGYPDGVVIGDFNGDGIPDLATAIPSSNSISVVLGQGDGTFGGHTEFATDQTPQMLVTGDLNGDGRPDLVTSNYYGYSVSVLVGLGDGRFTAAANYPTGIYPESVAIGDVNGDGKADLVTPNAYDNTVSVLLGYDYWARTDDPVGQFPLSAAIGDLNGDGKPDIAVANWTFPNSTISVLLGDGTGRFGARTDYPTGAGPYCVAIGDVTGDRIPDLVTANEEGSSVSVLPGNGDGTFGARTDYGAGSNPVYLAIADLNHDGDMDVVTANRDWTVSVLLSDRSTLAVGPTRMPTRFALALPRPNPSRALVQFDLDVPVTGRVRLELFDPQGRRVRTLEDGILRPGRYTRSWDGSRARTGLYFARLSAPGYEQTRKLLLTR